MIKMLMIGMFSFTATTLFFFQGIEIFQAFFEYFKQK
ncbi:EamA domain-containing membrane protein RarD [Cytobacillus horneckiae]